MDDVLSRVYAALDAVTTGPEAGELVVAEIFSPELWAMIRERTAIAAVGALREPTGAMLAAGCSVIPSGLHWATGSRETDVIPGTKIIWQAMIDAILAGKKDT